MKSTSRSAAAERGRKPDLVVGQGLAAGVPHPLEVDELLLGGTGQVLGRRRVGRQLEGQHVAALLQSVGLHLAEEGVEAAQWLLDGLGAHAAAPAPARVDQACLADPPQCLADGVPGDGVLVLQLHLAGEARLEVSLGEAAHEVLVQLTPEGDAAGAVELLVAVRGAHSSLLRRQGTAGSGRPAGLTAGGFPRPFWGHSAARGRGRPLPARDRGPAAERPGRARGRGLRCRP